VTPEAFRQSAPASAQNNKIRSGTVRSSATLSSRNVHEAEQITANPFDLTQDECLGVWLHLVDAGAAAASLSARQGRWHSRSPPRATQPDRGSPAEPVRAARSGGPAPRTCAQHVEQRAQSPPVSFLGGGPFGARASRCRLSLAFLQPAATAALRYQAREVGKDRLARRNNGLARHNKTRTA